MGKFILVMMVICTVTNVFAQENKTITEKLKPKYGSVFYHEINGGGWYSVEDSEGKEGACDTNGKEVIPPIWDNVSFMGDYYVVEKDGKVGIRGLKNEELLPCNRYTDVSWYEKKMKIYKGLCIVEINGKKGVIGKDNKEIIPCEYSRIDLMDGEMISVTKGTVIGTHKDYSWWKIYSGPYGLLDYAGKTLIPCEYSNDLSRGRTYHDGSYSIIACKEGSMISDKRIKDGKWGLIDINNKIMVPFEYDAIGHVSEGLVPVCKRGEHLYSPEYVSPYKGGKWGFCDVTGKMVVPLEYDIVTSFANGIAQVTKNGVTSILEHPLKGTNLRLANGGGVSVDTNIPSTGKSNENTFAFIIANENYAHFTGADYSINDGKVFAEYCKKTLGIPEKNVRYYEDATFGNITNAVKKLQDIADVYEGDAKIIFYYSGLGATADKSMEKYLLATDASMAALENTGYSVNALLKTINGLNVEYSWVVLDAPFSNLDKNGKSLASGRGVAMKSNPTHAEGKTIVTLSSSGEQTAYSSKKFGHSLFTYGLLEKLQQTKGACTIKELNDHAIGWVKKHAMAEFDKLQTPSALTSEKFTNLLNNIKF